MGHYQRWPQLKQEKHKNVKEKNSIFFITNWVRKLKMTATTKRWKKIKIENYNTQPTTGSESIEQTKAPTTLWICAAHASVAARGEKSQHHVVTWLMVVVVGASKKPDSIWQQQQKPDRNCRRCMRESSTQRRVSLSAYPHNKYWTSSSPTKALRQ